jgi:two-component system nitrogen regulation response regulator GlnG
MTKINAIWIVDDDRSIRWVLEKALEQANIPVRTFEQANDLLKALQNTCPAAVISDIRMPGIDGLELLEKIKTLYPELPVIITTAHSDLDSAVASFQGGAFEYLPKPFDIDEVIATVRRALSQHPQSKTDTEEKTKSRSTATGIIGEAPAMQEVFRAIGRLSNSHITVLINGQSGTGKELVARALHRHSPRSKKPFIALNMAAIPKDLIESELFGHEKGAFTGAAERRIGRFEQANGGTLFLDEIGDMPAETQTRLLRVLADSEFYRIGGHEPIKVDVRIIAATHQYLEKLVEENRFREDLFHRLNVIRIHIPSLAERAEDIPKLAEFFFKITAKELRAEPKHLLKDTENYLMKLSWPGNVRQLENICRWLTVMAPGREIHINDLPPELHQQIRHDSNDEKNKTAFITENWQDSLALWAYRALSRGETRLLDYAAPEFERIMLEAALKHTRGRRRDAAELLGWGRNTLTRKLKELGINEDDEA